MAGYAMHYVWVMFAEDRKVRNKIEVLVTAPMTIWALKCRAVDLGLVDRKPEQLYMRLADETGQARSSRLGEEELVLRSACYMLRLRDGLER